MRVALPFVAQLADDDETAWLEVLRSVLLDYELLQLSDLTAEQRAAAEVAIVANPNPADLATLPNLKWVQSLWAGVERLVAETQEASFAIVRLQDPQLAATMAEAILAWTLYLHRGMPRYLAQQAAHIWQQHPLPLPSQRTIGLLGLGNLGQAAAHALTQHGFTVWGWSRTPTQIDPVQTACGQDGFYTVLQQSNILVCLLPLTHQTKHLLNHETLGLLPPGASLINFARGPIVDTNALIHHLDSGHLTHAVLDVFDEEPLPPHSPLWRHPSITVLPHIAAPTNKQTASQLVAINISNYFRHREMPPTVNRALGY